jgi:hypothetical protein
LHLALSLSQLLLVLGFDDLDFALEVVEFVF